MLIMLFIVFLAVVISAIIVGYVSDGGFDGNAFAGVGSVLGAFLLVIVTVILIVGGVNLSKERTIDNKIQMYTEENANIETSITTTVEKYLEHELNIFDNLQGEDIQTLLVVYPEINSNELVKRQIEVFIDNNNKIKELKEQKLNIEIWKFWVYFG